MEHWRLLDLGGLEPYGTQTLYEAVALARARCDNEGSFNIVLD